MAMKWTKADNHWLDLLRGSARTPVLGKRELSVLEALWQSSPQSAAQVHDKIVHHGIGLNTVQSTLERLCRKGLLVREKSGRSYLYAANVSREEIIASPLTDIAQNIAGGDMGAMISGFRAYVGDQRQRAGSAPQNYPGRDDGEEEN